MPYLHCHNCDFEQDDFYTVDGYNPASSLKSWMEALCGPDIDKQFTTDPEFVRTYGPITTREVIARNFEDFAKSIREMKWITIEQWEKDCKTAVCPKCGAQNFDID